MHPTGSVFTRFDFDVVTGPVEPLPARKPSQQPSSDRSDPEPATAVPARKAPSDPIKPPT
jgi:hypothetical protein